MPIEPTCHIWFDGYLNRVNRNFRGYVAPSKVPNLENDRV